MTELLYTNDAYLKDTEAEITQVVENGVVLNKTIFYPMGGGQPKDEGFIITTSGKELKVQDLKKTSNNFVHIINTEDLNECSVGDKVKLQIDWEYRYKLMKHHTSLHVLSAVVYNKYQAKVTGGNIYSNKARLDFDLAEFNKTLAEELVNETNEELQKDHKVSVEFITREEADQRPELIRTKINLLPSFIREIRLVKIGDIDIQADGGLHVNSTAEIGQIELIKIENKGKGRKRISIGVVT